MASTDFKPFREDLECSDCGYRLAIMLQPLHMEIPIHCPACGHNLTYLIRQAIRRQISDSVPA